MLSLLPLAMRMGGPREAVWHAIIRKNHGCTHFIVGRDHAGPGSDASGKPFYGPYDAQELLRKHEEELGVRMVRFKMMVYLADEDRYVPEDEVPEGSAHPDHLGHRTAPAAGRGPRDPGVVHLPRGRQRAAHRHAPAASQQGFTVFFTGLSGSGKSTIANALLVKLLEMGGRPVTLLDGDLVRKHLSSELGFSKEHRDLNIRRIGYVASEITKNGGIAICAPIAPYDQTRKDVRAMIEPAGGFILVHVATPLEVCEDARPQGPLRQGAGRDPQGVHRHLRSLRGADGRRSRDRHHAVLPGGGRQPGDAPSGAARLPRRQRRGRLSTGDPGQDQSPITSAG